MSEQPAYRFSNVELDDERRIAIACEVWLCDICAAAWANKESMKIAALVTRHIMQASATPLHIKDLESRYNLTRSEIMLGLNLIKIFGFLDGFFLERNELMISPRISNLQLFKVLETSQRLQQLQNAPRGGGRPYGATDPEALTGIAEDLVKDRDAMPPAPAYSI